MQLQIFIQDRLGIKGKWSCPGGSSKRFKAKEGEFILNWYFKKQSRVLFQGTQGINFKSKLIEQLENVKRANDHVESNSPTKNRAENEAGPIFVEDENAEGEVNLANISLDINSTNSHNKTSSNLGSCSCNCKSISTEIEDIKLDIAILQNRIDITNSDWMRIE